jgi:hypothetical protein
MSGSVKPGHVEWDQLAPKIFNDANFHKANGSSRRFQRAVNGTKAGFVVAWRPANYDNFALNKADFDRLLELRRNDSFDAAFVVIAAVTGSYDTGDFNRVYVGHRDAEQLAEILKSARLRKGPHGEYWLLQEDCSPLETTYTDDIPW